MVGATNLNPKEALQIVTIQQVWEDGSGSILRFIPITMEVIGIVATVIYVSPGGYFISIGPLQLDMLYLSPISFRVLFALSATDKYDPEGYGISLPDSEK